MGESQNMVSQSSRSPPTPLGWADRPDPPRTQHLYPIPIPIAKQARALQLYKAYLLADRAIRATQSPAVGKSHDRYHLQVPGGAPIQSATTLRGSSKIDKPGLVDTSYLDAADSFSILSFDDTQLKQTVKPHRRSKLVGPAREKDALIRWLGACWACRSRKVACPLDHHDIEYLRALDRKSSITDPKYPASLVVSSLEEKQKADLEGAEASLAGVPCRTLLGIPSLRDSILLDIWDGNLATWESKLGTVLDGVPNKLPRGVLTSSEHQLHSSELEPLTCERSSSSTCWSDDSGYHSLHTSPTSTPPIPCGWTIHRQQMPGSSDKILEQFIVEAQHDLEREQRTERLVDTNRESAAQVFRGQLSASLPPAVRRNGINNTEDFPTINLSAYQGKDNPAFCLHGPDVQMHHTYNISKIDRTRSASTSCRRCTHLAIITEMVNQIIPAFSKESEAKLRSLTSKLDLSRNQLHGTLRNEMQSVDHRDALVNPLFPLSESIACNRTLRSESEVLDLGQSNADSASLADTASEDDADQDSLDIKNEPQVPILWKLLGIDIRRLRGFLPNQCPTPDSQTKQSSGSQSSTTLSTTKSQATSTDLSSASNQVRTNDNEALSENSVTIAVESKPAQPEYGSRKLVCHLAAYGITTCPNGTFKSPRAMLIINDHICPNPYNASKAAIKNHHRQPNPCPRCKLAFASKQDEEEHQPILESIHNPCVPLADQDLVNDAIKRKGMCWDKATAVKIACSSQANMAHWTQQKTSWIEQHTVLYIGKSKVSRDKAQKELSDWYTIAREIFPEVETPPSPFVDNSGALGSDRYKRILGHTQGNIDLAIGRGNFPKLNTQQVEVLRRAVIDALDVSAIEIVEDEEAKIKSKKRKRDRNVTADVTNEAPPATQHPRLDDENKYIDPQLLDRDAGIAAMGNYTALNHDPESPNYPRYDSFWTSIAEDFV